MTKALQQAFRERMVSTVRFFAAAPDDSSARRELAALLAYGPGAVALFNDVVAELSVANELPLSSLASLRAFAAHAQRSARQHSVSSAWLDIPPAEDAVDDTVLLASGDTPPTAAAADKADPPPGSDATPLVSPDPGAPGRPAADPELPPGTLCAGRYVIDAPVAIGGMSTVYRATDRRDGRAVALKVLRQSLAEDPDLVAAFEREADNAWTLRHPGFVQVLAQGWIEARPFLALEYLEGESLGSAMKRQFATGVSWPVARRILVRIGATIADAHRHGLIHADLKPGNIFLLENGDPRVLDLGAAQIMHDDPRLEGEPDDDPAGGALTPAYASPEMLLGASAEPRDDIFSLAVIAYELVVGRHPFERYTADRARHLDLRPARPPGLPAYAWRTLRRGLALRREQRPATMAAFVAGLRRPFPIVTLAAGGLALAVLAGLVAWSHRHPEEAQAGWDTGHQAIALAVDLAGLRPLPDRPEESLALANRLADRVGWEAPRRTLVERLNARAAPSALADAGTVDVEQATGAIVTLRRLGLASRDEAASVLAVTRAITARLSDLILRTRPLAVDAISWNLTLLREIDPDAVRVVAPHLTDLLNARRHSISSDVERAEFDRLATILVQRFPIVPPPVGGTF